MIRRRRVQKADKQPGYQIFVTVAIFVAIGVIAYILLMFVGVIDGFGFNSSP